jgi:hypothetical protein
VPEQAVGKAVTHFCVTLYQPVSQSYSDNRDEKKVTKLKTNFQPIVKILVRSGKNWKRQMKLAQFQPSSSNRLEMVTS